MPTALLGVAGILCFLQLQVICKWCHGNLRVRRKVAEYFQEVPMKTMRKAFASRTGRLVYAVLGILGLVAAAVAPGATEDD